MQLSQQLAPLPLRFWIVFLGVLHSEAGANQMTSFVIFTHFRVEPSQLDVVHETVGIEGNRFLETLRRLFVSRVRQLSKGDLCQGSLDPVHFSQIFVPEA